MGLLNFYSENSVFTYNGASAKGLKAIGEKI